LVQLFTVYLNDLKRSLSQTLQMKLSFSRDNKPVLFVTAPSEMLKISNSFNCHSIINSHDCLVPGIATYELFPLAL